MSGDNNTQETCMIWIDWENKIISFKEAENFEAHRCASRDEKLMYALERCAYGFRIQ